MKKITFLILSVIILSCSPTKRTKLNIEKSYSNAIFTPGLITKNTTENLKLTIEPVDAKILNKEIFDASNLDGSYEKMFISSYISQFQDKVNLTAEDKKKLEMAKLIEDYLDTLFESKTIDENVALNFKEKIYNTFLYNRSFGWTGNEVDKLVFNERYNNINPYFIDNRYFSLFKITFTNSGSEIEEADIKNLQVYNGNELLYPFNKEYFESTLKGDNQKLKFIYRMNMPELMKIVPNQTVVKYIAVPPINIDNKILSVNYVNDKTVETYDFSVTLEKKYEKYVFDSFSILQPAIIGIKNFYIIQNGEFTFSLLNNDFYINDLKLNEEIIIYKLKVDSNRKKVSLEQKSIIPSQVKNGIIKIIPTR